MVQVLWPRIGQRTHATAGPEQTRFSDNYSNHEAATFLHQCKITCNLISLTFLDSKSVFRVSMESLYPPSL